MFKSCNSDSDGNKNGQHELQHVVIEQRIRRTIRYENSEKAHKRRLRHIKRQSNLLKQQQNEHDIHVQNWEEHNMWRSCCGLKVDSRMVTYGSQLFVGLVSITFCIFQLIYNQCDKNSSSYLALFGFTVGFFLPQPNLKEK